MTVPEEQNNNSSSTNPKREKLIASIREQIAASTSDEERAIFEGALQRELALKDMPVSAPVAQTMDQDKDPEPKKEEEELSCCTRLLLTVGDMMEEQREHVDEKEYMNAKIAKAKNEQK